MEKWLDTLFSKKLTFLFLFEYNKKTTTTGTSHQRDFSFFLFLPKLEVLLFIYRINQLTFEEQYSLPSVLEIEVYMRMVNVFEKSRRTKEYVFSFIRLTYLSGVLYILYNCMSFLQD